MAALADKARATARSLQPKLVAWRRDLHRHPEPGFGEFRTANVVSERLRALGLDVRIAEEAMDPTAVHHRHAERIAASGERAIRGGVDPGLIEHMRTGGTAVVADLRGGDGPVVGFRFDMDCLPILESGEPQHRPAAEGFRSEVDGEMHACGHDGHIAMGLGVATVLARLRDQLGGTVRLVFQPAEEGAMGGAAAITARGLVDDVDHLVCVHLGLGAPTGTFVTRAYFLATSKYRVTFAGRGAHVVNSPQSGRNALLAAASATLTLHSIAPHGDGWFSLNVGVLRAGDEQGVTPPSATMELGFWADRTDVHDYVEGRVREAIAGSAAAHGVGHELARIGGAPAADQNEDLARAAGGAALTTDGVEHIEDAISGRAGEDANVFLQRVAQRGGRGIYVLVGSDLADGHHSPRFDFDERSLVIGTEALSALACDLLERKGV
jgi:aminobenzoyl-glutamate utilization protein A